MRSLLLLAIPVLLGAQSPEQLFRAGRLDDAQAAFQARLSADRNDANAMYFLGRIALARQKPGDAAEWFEKAARRDDANALYHYWLGSALGEEAQNANKLRQPFLARRVKASFERAVQRDPTMVEPRLGLVDFYSVAPGVMGGSMTKAREQAGELLKLNPMRGHMAMARIAARERDAAGEEQELRAAIEAAPDSTPPYLNLAALLRRQSRWDDAFAIYERWIGIRPNDPLPRALWGITAGQSGRNMERGERELDFYLANLPEDVSPVTVSAVHYRRGQIYERTGRLDRAKAAYDEAVRLNPRNTEAKAARAALK